MTDEMGLGKTLQAISMITWLHDSKHVAGPFRECRLLSAALLMR
jgi:SNF2 family DNA or RNA helicase